MKRRILGLMGIVFVGICAMTIGCMQPDSPRLGAAGIGVSDMEKSLDFYTRVVGMKIKSYIKKKNMDQVVLEFKESKGSDVILLHYTDDTAANYKDVPAKLVFYVADAYAFADAIRAEGLTILTEPAPTEYGAVVGMAKDPDGYWIEIVEDPETEKTYLGAVGIGVSDLEASAAFYTTIMGMTEQYRLSVPNLMNEIILQYPYDGGGSGVVLMNYLYPKNYTDNPVKLTFFASDPNQTLAAIADAGAEVIHTPKPTRKFNPLAYGSAKDIDGYLLDIMQSTEKVEEEEKETEPPE